MIHSFIEDQVWCVVEPLIKKYLDTHFFSEDHVYLGTHTKMAVCIPSWCRGWGSEILPHLKKGATRLQIVHAERMTGDRGLRLPKGRTPSRLPPLPDHPERRSASPTPYAPGTGRGSIGSSSTLR